MRELAAGARGEEASVVNHSSWQWHHVSCVALSVRQRLRGGLVPVAGLQALQPEEQAAFRRML